VQTVNRDYELLKEQKEDTARLKKLYFGARKGMWAWPTSGAVCGLAGGVIAAISGTLLLAIAWAIGDESSGLSLHGIGSILLLSTMPLLILGACCLDLVEKREEKNQQSIHKGTKGEAPLNGHSRLHVAVTALFLAMFCSTHSNTWAQQTVFNVPTTDVLDKRKVYFELDISVKPNDSDAVNKFSSFVPRLVIGAGGRVEVGLNVLGNVQPGADSTTLAPAVKWKVYEGQDNGWAIALGNNLYFPVHNRAEIPKAPGKYRMNAGSL
jgi:hypothetical protein